MFKNGAERRSYQLKMFEMVKNQKGWKTKMVEKMTEKSKMTEKPKIAQNGYRGAKSNTNSQPLFGHARSWNV